MAWKAIVNRDGVAYVIVEEQPEGVYMLVFNERSPPGCTGPDKDYLQDTLEIAKSQAMDDYGVRESDWVLIPDIGFNQ